MLQGYNVWSMYNQYYIDVLMGGLAQSKYGESAGLLPNSYCDGMWYYNVSPNLQGISSGGLLWADRGTGELAGVHQRPAGLERPADTAVQNGLVKLIASLRGINPSFLVGGNGAGNIVGTAGNPNYGGGDYEIYSPMTWDLYLAEAVFGESYSKESYQNSPPGFWMNFLSYAASKRLSSTGMIIMGSYGYPRRRSRVPHHRAVRVDRLRLERAADAGVRRDHG